MPGKLRVLLDTAVVLDVLLRRKAGVVDAEPIWQATEDGQLKSYMTASSLCDIYYYIARKLAGGKQARRVVRQCLEAATILPVDQAALEEAYALALPDLENGLRVVCASRAHLDAIIASSPAGYAGSPVAVLSPLELTARLAARRSNR